MIKDVYREHNMQDLMGRREGEKNEEIIGDSYDLISIMTNGQIVQNTEISRKLNIIVCGYFYKMLINGLLNELESVT